MANERYPEHSIEEVEALADHFLAEYFAHIGQSPISTPIPVEDMAEHYLGFAIDITDEGLFSDPDFIGGIDFDAEKIYVNTSIEDHDGRYAFTVAHEIGHYLGLFHTSEPGGEHHDPLADTSECTNDFGYDYDTWGDDCGESIYENLMWPVWTTDNEVTDDQLWVASSHPLVK